MNPTVLVPALSRHERALIARLRTPAQVQAWLNALPYNVEKGGETLRSFRGVVRTGSSQMLPVSDFPNLLPSLFVTRGSVTPCAATPSVRLMRSVPAVMFPHWSLPPICNVTP